MALVNCFLNFGDDQNPVGEAVRDSFRTKVGDLFGLLWDFSLGGITNLLLLYRNAQKLADEMTQLEELRDDLQRRANAEAAQPQTEVMHQVRGWFVSVGKLRSEVRQFQDALDRQSLAITGLCLGYAAVGRLKRAQELATQGRAFSSVTGAAAPGADTLAGEIEELTNMKNDLMRTVETKEAADPQMRRTNLVDSWLKQVEAVLSSAGEIDADGAVVGKLKKVNHLKALGKTLQERELVSLLPPDAVEEVPNVPSSSIIGREEVLAEIHSCLRDEELGILGIYGMAGVGKTTLLRKLNNELLPAGGGGAMFDVVAWVTVSKQLNVLAIQYEIGKRMGLPFSGDFSGAGEARRSGDQAGTLFRALSRKRFLLLLDDLWEKLDLEMIGIPHPKGRRCCKIAFATRSVEVCTDMDADRKIQVTPLDGDRSWELFCRKTGRNEALDDPSVLVLAKEVVGRCGGLPVFLVTVARAMARRENRHEWQHAIDALDELATELRGMEPVLSSLKSSYDGLENDTLRSCLLYCALLPEDAEVSRESLVESWVREGLLDDGRRLYNIDRARNRGHAIVGRLQDACLLKFEETAGGQQAVGTHHAVRDMAYWLTSNAGAGAGVGSVGLAEVN